MTQFPTITTPVQVHTSLDKKTKAILSTLSRKTNVPQCVYINAFVAKGLAAMPGVTVTKRKATKRKTTR